MARIVYGVMGDSRGHVSRAKAVAEELPHHEYLFVGGGTVSYLEHEGYGAIHTPVLGTEIRGSRVRVLSTIYGAARLLPRLLSEIDRVARIVEQYDPDLILTDYEFFAQAAALRLRRPCVSLDNQHMLTQCRYEPPPGHRINRLMTLLVMRTLYGAANAYLVTSFYPLQPKDRTKTQVLPPVIRRSALRHSVSQADHGVVYLRGGIPKALLSALRKRRRPFIIYGGGHRLAEGNLLFKDSSDGEFLQDLASCRYVVCNGGHSTITEALFYGKPALCYPVRLFYEQLVNAHLLFRAGYGDYCMNPGDWENTLSRFETRLDRYVARIREKDFWGNEIVAKNIEDLIRQGNLK